MSVFRKILFVGLYPIIASLAVKAQVPGEVLSHTKISASTSSLGQQSYWKFFGSGIRLIKDLDGDGIRELAAGNTIGSTGYVYLMRMNANATPKAAYTVIGRDTGGIVNYHAGAWLGFGSSIANMGDMNGNGIDELLVSCSSSQEYFLLFLNQAGKVDSFKEFGPLLGNIPTVSPASQDFGWSVTNLGDLDHDGTTDIAVSDPNYDGQKGAVWILFLKPDGQMKSYKLIKSNTAGFNYALPFNGYFGIAVTGIGDLDKDGQPDLMVGSVDGIGLKRGDAFTLFLNTDGTVKGHYHYVPGTSTMVDTISSSSYFAYSMNAIGDIDGDTVVDVAVGEQSYQDSLGTRCGRIHIWMLNKDGSIKATKKIDKYHGNFTATLKNGDAFGNALADVGDWDGDGKLDLLASAAGDDDAVPASTSRNSGAVYFLFLDGIGSPPVQNAVGDLIYNRTNNYYAYPNPTSDRLIIRPRDKNSVIEKVELFDLSGKKLQTIPTSNSVATILVGELSSGTYLVSVTDKQGTQTIQFVKR